MKKTLLALSVLALGLGGCSAHIDGGSPATPVIKGAPPSSQPTVLEGNWATGCVSASGLYLSATLAFVGNSNNGTVKLYSDENCATMVQEQNQGGTFTISGPASVEGASNIDFVTNGKSSYDIFKIDGDSLYFGNSPGDSPATRSSALNTRLPFMKAK